MFDSPDYRRASLNLGPEGEVARNAIAADMTHAMQAAHHRVRWADRQTASFAGVMVLVAIVFSILMLNSYRDVLADSQRDQLNLAQVIANQINDSFLRAEGDLRAIGHVIKAEDMSASLPVARVDDLNALLEAHLVKFPEVTNLYVFGAQGSDLYHAGHTTQAISAVASPWFKQLMNEPQTDLVISDVEENPATGLSSILLAVPLRSPGGKWLGAAVARIDLEHFQATIRQISMAPSSQVMVHRISDGAPILRQPLENAASPQGEELVVRRARQGEGAGVGEFPHSKENADRRYAFRRLNDYPLSVSISVTVDDVLDEWGDQCIEVGILLLLVEGVMLALYIRQRRSQSILRQANTALRHSETLLQESEERFRITFEQAAVGIVHNGFDRCLLRFNRRFCDILGYEETELTGQSYLRFTHADDVGMSDEAVAPLLRGERSSVTWEKRYLRKDGTTIWVRLTSSLQRSSEGYPLHFITVVEDVTHRKQMEERLLREATRYEGLLRTASDGIHVLDEDGGLIEASDSFFRMLGYQPQDREMLNIRDWDVGAAREVVMDRLRRHMCELSNVFETRHRRRDGTVFDVEIHAGKVIIDGKRYLYASSRDVSGRKLADAAREQAELELRATSARMRLVLDTAAEGIIGMDDETRIIFANRAAADMLGFASPEAMLTRPCYEILGVMSPVSGDDGWRSIRQTLNDGEIRRVSDEIFRGPNGTPRPVEYVAAPLLVENIPVGVVVAFHDISERKAMEGDLKRSNAELEQFAYVVSHDLRQPLRMISSYLGLIERALNGKMDDDLKTFFGFASGGAKRMDKLIVDLLEYSRVGRQGGPLMPLPLRDVVADGVQNLTVAIGEAQATVDVAENLPQIMGDRSELVRLFQNLIGNAVKYRLPDRVCHVQVGCQPHGRDWVLWVKDNGIGIAERDFDRAFGVFQRLVGKEQYEGTGIGLAVCKKIVERHGGRIWIESKVGEGSTFMFTIPMI